MEFNDDLKKRIRFYYIRSIVCCVILSAGGIAAGFLLKPELIPMIIGLVLYLIIVLYITKIFEMIFNRKWNGVVHDIDNHIIRKKKSNIAASNEVHSDDYNYRYDVRMACIDDDNQYKFHQVRHVVKIDEIEAVYRYYKVGDRVSNHIGLRYPYNHDHGDDILCLVCGRHNKNAARCSKCNRELQS